MKYFMVVLCFLVTACQPKSETANDGTINVSNGYGEGGIIEIKLKDGTPCAVLVGAGKGSITCNWPRL